MGTEATLGAIVRAKGGEFLKTYPSTTPVQCKVLRAIADCRTPALGGHRDHCDHCGYERVFWNSCRNRHCPGCGAEAREAWLVARREELLDAPYFHAVLTIPDTLHPIVLHNQVLLYAILLRAAGQALTDVGRTKLRAQLGVLAILHTWSQILWFHPHIHCVIPGGGFSLDGLRWVRVRKLDFLFAVKVLSRRFRTLVTKAIQEAYADGTLVLPPSIARDRTALDLLLAKSWKTDWHAYIKPPFGGPEQVLSYLAAYTHRMAISNHRIRSFDGETVTFSYRDYDDGNAHKTMSLPATEFLWRFVQHVVPPRFVRIRYYGFLANSSRSVNIEKARQLIGSKRELEPRPALPTRLCPECKAGTMRPVALVLPQCHRTWFDTS